MKKTSLQSCSLLSCVSLLVLLPLTATAQPPHPPRHGGHIMKMVEEIDTDKNGTLTKAEIDAGQSQRFAEMDSNKDGNLNISEFESQWASQQRNRMVDGFQRLDEDGDGKVTRNEFDAPLDKLLKHRDVDNNGELSREELRSGGKKQKRNKKEFQTRGRAGINEPASVY